MANVINWFEIPVADIQRATKFYSDVMDYEFTQQEMMGFKMAFFPMEGEGIGGSLIQGEGYIPSMTGAVVYLNGGEDLSVYLNRVEAAVGKIVFQKTKISDEIGYMAFFIDSEGNRVAFHSLN